MSLILLAALSDNNVIGKDNTLPWHIPEDLKRFRGLTFENPVIMGRKTYESILQKLKKPLDHRINIVLSQTLEDHDVIVKKSVREILSYCYNFEKAYVIGGQQVYASFLPFCSIMELTRVHNSLDGNTFFPEVDWKEWRNVNREENNNGKYSYSFVRYEKQ